VTGGSRGIGLATVESLVASGARVAFTGRNETVGEDAAGELHAGGGDVLFVPADAGSEDDCRKMVESALTPMGVAHPEMHVLALRLVSILNCLVEIGLGSWQAQISSTSRWIRESA